MKLTGHFNIWENVVSKLPLLILLFCLALLSGVLSASDQEILFVSIPPHKYIVDRIGGEFVDVQVMIGPGQSPATFEPSPGNMVDLQSAGIYFKTGLPFEDKILASLRDTETDFELVDLRADIQLRQLEHHHGDHTSTSGAKDPHIWLAPRLLKKQAETICSALCSIMPEHSELFRTNLSFLLAELDSLDLSIRVQLQEYKGGKVYIFHPTLGYFCDAYDLEQVAVEAEGKEPSPRQLAGFIEQFQDDQATVIFVQPQFSSRSINAIADEIGAVVLRIDPLKYDVIENLSYITRNIIGSLTIDLLESQN